MAGKGSKTKQIQDTRERLLNVFVSYVKCAQNVDLRKEGDFDDLENEIDVVLEELIFPRER
jgi:hypothetical protein